MPDARILLVEDDPAMVQTIGWVLRQHGHAVRAACTAELVADGLDWEACDLALVDVADVEPLAAVRRIRADAAGTQLPLIVLGDELAEETVVEALALGAADVVRKPLRMRELLARIDARLRARAAERAAGAALADATAQLQRMRDAASGGRRLEDVLHEITGDLSPDEICDVLSRRLARALDLSHSAVVLARPGDRVGVVATAVEWPGDRNREIDLGAYPEVRAALDRGRPVVVGDVRASPLFESVRDRWTEGGEPGAPQSVVAVPFVQDRVQGGVLLLRRTGTDAPPLGVEEAAFAQMVARVAAAALERARLLDRTRKENAQLAALAHTDPLTQVLNRRALTTRLMAELERARRYESCVTLLLVDLDHFKLVNDTFGHLAGDEVLRELAGLLRDAVRSVDLVARFGGEEFVIVLPETSLAGAMAFAERLRERIAGQAFATGGRSRARVTVSVGVATYPAEGVDGVDPLLGRADAALYRAKAEGRNRVRA